MKYDTHITQEHDFNVLIIYAGKKNNKNQRKTERNVPTRKKYYGRLLVSFCLWIRWIHLIYFFLFVLIPYNTIVLRIVGTLIML